MLTQTNKQANTRWDYLSAVSGILGLALAFIPYASILGVLLGVAAVVFYIFGFRNQQKNSWSWLGLITGTLTMVSFLAIAGLVIFF